MHILHISDIHLKSSDEVPRHQIQLVSDLRRELNVHKLGYLVISGDIADKSMPEEYDAAYGFIEGLLESFSLSPEHVIVAPGNHDLNWNLSREAYHNVEKDKLPDPLPEGKYIHDHDHGVLLRDEDLYKKRFDNFSTHFFTKLNGKPYPQNYVDQGLLHTYPNDKILFLSVYILFSSVIE